MRSWTLPEAVAYGHGIERSFLCPVHGDSRPSASLNILKKVWYCYSCGARGTLTGENALIEPDYEQLRRWFEEKMEAQRVYPESWLSRWDAGDLHDYWRERVGEAAAAAFRLGHDPERNAVTYPLRDSSGAVLGVVRRALDADGPKYRYPTGVDIGRLLFNYSPEHRRTVVLVEGALDAIALWRVGVHAFAIYGAQLSSHQVNLIDRVDPFRVVCAYDNDEAGWRAYKQTKYLMPHRFVERLSWPLSWGKDVDELSEEHRRRVVSSLDRDDDHSIDSTPCRSDRSGSMRMSKTHRSASTSPPSRLTIRRSGT